MGIPLIGCVCAVCQSTKPKNKRLRCSLLVENEGTTLVIDCGPDFRQQMLRANVTQLDAILMTHEHNDHKAGLDDVRAYNLWQQKGMEVYATPQVQKVLAETFPYIFAEKKYPGAPVVELIELPQKSFTIGSIKILPINVIHGNLPVTCYRFGNFTYITDASYIAPQEMNKIRGTKILVLNALRKTEHWSHFNLEKALQIIEELQPEKAYLTHISHQMGDFDEVQNELPANVFLSYDGLTITCN